MELANIMNDPLSRPYVERRKAWNVVGVSVDEKWIAWRKCTKEEIRRPDGWWYDMARAALLLEA